MKDQLELGRLIEGDACRDAIHIAIAPVIAGEHLRPGQHVGFLNPYLGDDSDRVGHCDKPIGIVDPFLTGSVPALSKFYLFLYPNTVTGMRHEWRHPAFTVPASNNAKSESEAWLRHAAMQLGCSYDELMATWSPIVNGDYINNGEYIRDVWYELRDEFWKHYEIVTGKKLEDIDEGGFTCSC